MVNLPLDGLLQLLANAKANGILSTVDEVADSDRMVVRAFHFRDGMILGRNVVAQVGEYLNRAELEWDWRECKVTGGASNSVEGILLECARLADESKAVRS